MATQPGLGSRPYDPRLDPNSPQYDPVYAQQAQQQSGDIGGIGSNPSVNVSGRSIGSVPSGIGTIPGSGEPPGILEGSPWQGMGGGQGGNDPGYASPGSSPNNPPIGGIQQGPIIPPQGPFGSNTTKNENQNQSGTTSSTTAGASNTNQTGSQTGATTGAAQRGLTGGAAGAYENLLPELQGAVNNAGLTPAEAEAIRINPEQEAGIISTATSPIAGAANAARQNLLNASAARGGYAPGLNATMERVSQDQGRNAAKAALEAKLGVSEANRNAANTAAQTRISQQNTLLGQLGGVLVNSPNTSLNTAGTSNQEGQSNTGTTSQQGTNTASNQQSTSGGMSTVTPTGGGLGTNPAGGGTGGIANPGYIGFGGVIPATNNAPLITGPGSGKGAIPKPTVPGTASAPAPAPPAQAAPIQLPPMTGKSKYQGLGSYIPPTQNTARGLGYGV